MKTIDKEENSCNLNIIKLKVYTFLLYFIQRFLV